MGVGGTGTSTAHTVGREGGAVGGSLVAAPHVAQVHAAARAVAEDHDAHAVRDGVAREALKPGGVVMRWAGGVAWCCEGGFRAA